MHGGRGEWAAEGGWHGGNTQPSSPLSFQPEPGNLAGIQHIILVLSGKGGVGKSTISTELALALRHAGKKVSASCLLASPTLLGGHAGQRLAGASHESRGRPRQVGILDVDLCGPSIPRMLRAQGRAVHQGDSGWVPVFMDREQTISLVSVGFLLEQPDEALVWRGPRKNGNATPSCQHPTRPTTSGAWGKTGTRLFTSKMLPPTRTPQACKYADSGPGERECELQP